MATVVLFEVGEGLVEILRVNVSQDLPEYLAVFELVPCRDSAGELEGVDLEERLSAASLGCTVYLAAYPVEESFEDLRLEVIHVEDGGGDYS